MSVNHISSHSITAAEGDERRRQERADALAHQVFRTCDAIGNQLSRIQSLPVSVLALATGAWRSAVGIDFKAADLAKKRAEELVEIIGEHGTVEISGDAMTAMSLLANVESTLELIAPMRTLCDPRGMKE